MRMQKEIMMMYSSMYHISSTWRRQLASPRAGVGVPPVDANSRSRVPHESVVICSFSSCLKLGRCPYKWVGGLIITLRIYCVIQNG